MKVFQIEKKNVEIKIPKEIYDYIHKHLAMRVCDGHTVAKVIANGIPLPKEHGDLIDRSEVEKLDDKLCNTECGCCALENCFYHEARAIIKADKAESEDNE